MDLKQAALSRLGEPLKDFLVQDVMVGVIKVKLDEFVKDSSNTYDDALVSLLWPILEKAIVDAADKGLESLKG